MTRQQGHPSGHIPTMSFVAAAVHSAMMDLSEAGVYESQVIVRDGVAAAADADSGYPQASVQWRTVVVVLAPRDLPEPTEIRHRHGLTVRQAEIALLMAAGLSDKHIAVRLGITRHCVSRHGERIRAKLRISSRRHIRNTLTCNQTGQKEETPGLNGNPGFVGVNTKSVGEAVVNCVAEVLNCVLSPA